MAIKRPIIRYADTGRYEELRVGDTVAGASGGSSTGGVQFNFFRSNGLQVGDGFKTQIPYSGTITGWVIATKDGNNATITLDVKKSNYSGVPTFAEIDGTQPLALTTQNKAESTSVSSWTTAIAQGDHVEITVQSVSAVVTGVYGTINITKV